jgi:hypothetical protein
MTRYPIPPTHPARLSACVGRGLGYNARQEMNLNRFVAALAVGALALVSGCFYAPMLSPEVLKPDEYCAGIGVYGAVPGRLVGRFGWGTIYGRHGLNKDYDLGFGYSFPLGFYADVKQQLARQPLTAGDLCLSVVRRESFAADTAEAPPRCWVVGLTPSIAAGTDNLYGGAQVLVQCEMLSPRPALYVFPGLVGGASFVAAENPFRVMPSLGLFLDPGLNRRPVQAMVTAGVVLQFDLSDLSRSRLP